DTFPIPRERRSRGVLPSGSFGRPAGRGLLGWKRRSLGTPNRDYSKDFPVSCLRRKVLRPSGRDGRPGLLRPVVESLPNSSGFPTGEGGAGELPDRRSQAFCPASQATGTKGAEKTERICGTPSYRDKAQP